MSVRISGTLGFVTNSSSAITHFPKAVLEHPAVKHFMETYGIQNGIIGSELWNRARCETLAVTREQKLEVARRLRENSWSGDDDAYYGPAIDTQSDDCLLIYGDEYEGLISHLSGIIETALQEMGLTSSRGDYN